MSKKFFTAYDRAPSQSLDCVGASKTQTQFKNEADINHLINRYKNTGSFYDPLNPPNGSRRMPMFEDFADIPDYGEAQNIVADANARFMQLPATVRKFFDNDPTLLLAFINDPANRDKAVELGLVAPKEKTVPEDVVPVAEKTVPETVIPGEQK